jgi:hypothetical protein
MANKPTVIISGAAAAALGRVLHNVAQKLDQKAAEQSKPRRVRRRRAA